ncbi:MAG: hypothetical protein VX712_03320 [Bacteroidota bacterium]|nr:hypothetical protein [Bacteroidota bacterium]
MSRILFFLLIASTTLQAQDSTKNSNLGKLSGQVRSFYLHTSNKGDLKDFDALATGGHLKYQNTFAENWEVGVALYTTANMGLEDLSEPDARTRKTSRYEEGLFNRLNLDQRVTAILGELYVGYQKKQHHFRLGRMKYHSPLVNGQDGRMIPSLFQGIQYQFHSENTRIGLALFNEVAPRSTGEFFGIGESIGTYAVGRSQSGKPAAYTGQTEADFLFITHLEQSISKNLNLKGWNYFTENVSNSIYLKPEWQLSGKFGIHGEYLHQSRVGNGGNAVDSLRYFQDQNSDLIGLQLRYKLGKNKLFTLAYDRIFSNGQYLSPREWGREFLFSFQKRERSEGSANNHALVFYYHQDLDLAEEQLRIQSIFSLGHQWKPSVLDPVQSKYAVPDYTQINWDLFFHFRKLRNLKPELLLVTKLASGDIPENPNFYFNKTDMFQINLVLNYNF